VAKYDGSGTYQWSKRFGDADVNQYAQSVTGLAILSQDKVVVSGVFENNIAFDTTTYSSNGGKDAYVVVLDTADGTPSPSRTFGSTGNDTVVVASNPLGDVIWCAGGMGGALDLGVPCSVLDYSGLPDIYVARLNGDTLDCLWSDSFGSFSVQHATDIAVGADGEAVVGGLFWGTLDFGDGSPEQGNTSGGEPGSMFLAKFAETGAIDWATSVVPTTTANITLNSLAIDDQGDIWAVGYFSGTGINFGHGSFSADGWDMFVAKYRGSDGGLGWVRHFSHSGDQLPNAVAVGSDGKAIVVGRFNEGISLGAGGAEPAPGAASGGFGGAANCCYTSAGGGGAGGGCVSPDGSSECSQQDMFILRLGP